MISGKEALRRLMFVDSPDDLPVTLARGHVSDDHAVGAIVVESAFALGAGGLAPVELPPRTGTDPPDLGSVVLWEGASVTAHGTVACPAAPPYATPVSLAVGAAEERLVVFGPRSWTRPPGGGALRPSEPERFDRIAMGWDLAFGGAFDLPPGTVPGTDVPHPGGRVAYVLNEDGAGFYPDEERALGRPLPRIERADALVQGWSDRPEPGGLAPCPQLVALRLFHLARSREGSPPAEPQDPPRIDLDAAFLVQHHAPPRLVFRDLRAGAPVRLRGLDGGPVAFEIPESPIEVRTKRRGDPVPPLLRSVHVDAERRLVRVTHAHPFVYAPDTAPAWIRVTRRSR